MLRRTGLALTLLLCTSPTPAHDAFILDARRATPGPRLELVELPQAAGPSGKRYRLQVGPGLARGIVFGVFTKPFDHGFHEVESGFQVDESGALVAGQPGGARRRLDEIALGPGPYPVAAVWEVALVSGDRAVRIFAKAVPYPLTAFDGGCTISLELASHLGDRFLASGSGFPPGEDVLTEQLYSGRRIQKQVRVSPEGLLTPDLLSHRPMGADRGARYTVKARTCQASIEYNWGEPALIRR
jgi:hypothetical protein